MTNQPKQLNELALFAGAGGGILGGKLLGWRTICAVEWEPYPASVLVARQNDGILAPFPIWDDVRTFDGKPWRGRVDVVSGGFPCQDISAAGKGAGIEGARSSMWKHMARIVGEVLPRLVFVENSPLLVGRGLAVVLADLATLGYDARWGVVGADDAGAPHKRERIWIVANSGHLRGRDGAKSIKEKPTEIARCREDEWRQVSFASDCDGHDEETGELGDICSICGLDYCDECQCPGPTQEGIEYLEIDGVLYGRNMADTEVEGLEGRDEQGTGRMDGRSGQGSQSEQGWWESEPDLGRVAHGVAARVDRLKAIGNGQVPSVAALAWRILSETDR